MQDEQQDRELSTEVRGRRLKRIVIAHFLLVATFFIAALIFGNFA